MSMNKEEILTNVLPGIEGKYDSFLSFFLSASRTNVSTLTSYFK